MAKSGEGLHKVEDELVDEDGLLLLVDKMDTPGEQTIWYQIEPSMIPKV